jgi:hypothetical protein
MEEPAKKQAFAWQPLTAKGVAAFAGASFGRLWAVQLVFALAAAATVAWVLAESWFPPIRQAIRALPARGEIRSGQLSWAGASPQKLAENRFLSLAVDLNHDGLVRSPAHVQLEFGTNDFKMLSLLGTLHGRYPRGWILSFNQPELEPWFGAWGPPILALVAGGTVVGLFVCWAGLASLYFLPAWLIGFFANRNLGLGASWRLSGAALMPGCLLLTTALFFYGLSLLDVVHLLVAVGLHLLVGWIYVVAAALASPRHPAVADVRPNPFVPGPESKKPPPEAPAARE